MKKDYTSVKIFGSYLLIILFMLISSSIKGQSPCDSEGICVTQFNAGFNDANKEYLKTVGEQHYRNLVVKSFVPKK